jgi:hypothetical protein
MPRSKTQPLDPMVLESALSGLEIQRSKLDEQIAEVHALLGRRAPGRPGRSAERDSEHGPPGASAERINGLVDHPGARSVGSQCRRRVSRKCYTPTKYAGA